MILIHIIDFFYWLYPSVVESSVTATVVSITLSHRTTENEALLRGGAATCMSSLNHDNQSIFVSGDLFIVTPTGSSCTIKK